MPSKFEKNNSYESASKLVTRKEIITIPNEKSLVPLKALVLEICDRLEKNKVMNYLVEPTDEFTLDLYFSDEESHGWDNFELKGF